MVEKVHKKWKILYTIPNFDTAGSGKALLNIATRLDNKYFEPHIACLHNKGEFFKVVEKSGIPIHIFQFIAPMKLRIKGLFKCWEISKEMKKINPNLIHSFHYAPDYSEAIAARMADIPWIFTKKNMNWGGKSKNGWKLRRFLAYFILAQNTDMLRDYFPRRKNVSLVPRGVDTDEFSYRPKDTNLMYKYNISTHEKVILTVANLVPVKNIEILIKAFELLCNNDKIYLFIIGDKNNNYGKALEDKVNKLIIKNRIYFTDKVQNVAHYYSIADVFVLPTRKEGSPVVLLEAMASGVPVLATNVPGSCDILNSIPNQLFAPEDVSALEDKLNWLLNMDNDKRKQIINIQFEIIKGNYSIEREVKQHASLYKRLCNLK